MDAQRRKTFRVKFSGFHLLLLVYCLALAGTLAWLNVETQSEVSLVQIDSVKNIERHGDDASLVFAGEGFHKSLRGYYVERAHAFKEPLWSILSGTSVRALDVKDGLVLAACFQNKLVSIDVTDEDRPIILDSLEMPESISAIKILDDKAVVGMSHGGGLAVVDLSDPEGLQLYKQITPKSRAYSLVSIGSQVFYADFNRGLGLLDVKSESISQEIVANIERPWSLASNGKSVAIASLLGVIELFDVSVEGVVEPRAKIQFPDLDEGDIRGVAFIGDYLLAAFADRKLKAFTAVGENLFEISSLELPGIPYSLMASPQNLFVSLVGSGIVKVDITAEGQCFVAGHQAMPTTVISMAADKKTVYLAGLRNYKGLSAFPLNSYEELLPKSWEYIDYQSQSFFRWDNDLYGYRRDKTLVELSTGPETSGQQIRGNLLLARDKDGVGVFNRHPVNKKRIVRQGSLIHPNRIMGAISNEGALYLLHLKGLDVFVGPRLDRMNLVTKLEIEGQPVAMAPLTDNHLLVATQQAGIMVIDLVAKDAPRIVSTLLSPSHLRSNTIARNISLVDSIAYVSQGSGGVYVIDVSRPDDIKLLQIIDTPGVAKEMVVKDDLLVVADGDMGVFLIDIANKREPAAIGSLPTPVTATTVSFSADGLLVSDHPGGTIKLPLPSKLKGLALVDDEELHADISKIDHSGYAYIYDDSSSSRVRVKAN